MSTYNVTSTPINAPASGTMLRLAFGQQGQNNEIVRDAAKALTELSLPGGELVLLNGPASLPAAVVIAHAVAHTYGAVGVFDPKMASYVIAVAHGGRYAVGDLIAAVEVREG